MKQKNVTRGMMMATVLSLGLFTACTDQTEGTLQQGTPMSVAVQSDAYARSVLIEDAFQAGVQIGVFLIEEDKTTYNETEYHNLHYTFTDGTWNIDDPLKTPRLTDVEGKAVAYHPWSNAVTDYTQIPVTTAAQKDVMYSGWTEGINNANSEATFTMKHAMAALRLAVKVDETYTTAALLTAISAKSDAFYASATMDATDGSLDNLTEPGVALANDAVNHTLTTTAHNVDFVVVPGTTAQKITFTATVGGKPYTASFTPQNPLAQGKIHTYTLTLSATGMTVGTVAVEEWLDGEGKDDLNLTPAVSEENYFTAKLVIPEEYKNEEIFLFRDYKEFLRGNESDEELQMYEKYYFYYDQIERIYINDVLIPEENHGKITFGQAGTYNVKVMLNDNFTKMAGMMGMFGVPTNYENIYGDIFNNDIDFLVEVDFTHLDTKNVVSMYGLFAGERKWRFNMVGFENLNTQNVEDMSAMLMGLPFESIDVSHFNTSKLQSTYWMFLGWTNLRQIDLSNWDLSNILTMDSMFYGCQSLTSVKMAGPLNDEVVVTYMFSGINTTGTFYYDSRYDYSKIIAVLPATWTAVPY